MTLLDAPKFDAVRDRRKRQALWVGVATIALLACVPWVKKLMGGVK